MTEDLLDRVLEPHPPAFALLYRPETTSPGVVEILVGTASVQEKIADLPLPEATAPTAGAQAHDLLVLVPYRQLAERGFACRDDGTPLAAIAVTDQVVLPVTAVLNRIPDVPILLSDGHFDVDDQSYAEVVRRIVADEIGTGKGANFVIKRSFTGTIENYRLGHALALFRRLLRRETGAYWTFLVHTGMHTLVGASPERHLSMREDTAVMNPISGTYRYPSTGPNLRGMLTFLADAKETDELSMVLDEELKMMARICDGGGRFSGPYLREMARLAHTEYLIQGRCTNDPRTVLRETMFAPAVTGSPLESACRVISKYEPAGRGYYSGVIALIGRDATGQRAIDSSILIRTADIANGGRLEVGTGATLTRHSDPATEVAETKAKVAALLGALNDNPERLAEHREAQSAAAANGSGIGLSPLSYSAAIPGGDQVRTGVGATLVREVDSRTEMAETETANLLAAPKVGVERFADHAEVRVALMERSAGLADFWMSTDRDNADATLAGQRALIVDAEDSFTAMLEQQLRSLGLKVTVCRVDQPHLFDDFSLVVMGPGPGDPRSVDEPRIARLRSDIDDLLRLRVPLLAVCLSHQLLSVRLGLRVERKNEPNQGARREVNLFGKPRQVGFYNTFAAHSGIDELNLTGIGRVQVCRDTETNEVHALRGPSFGSLQFHAESVLTSSGPDILASLLKDILSANSRR